MGQGSETSEAYSSTGIERSEAGGAPPAHGKIPGSPHLCLVVPLIAFDKDKNNANKKREESKVAPTVNNENIIETCLSCYMGLP